MLPEPYAWLSAEPGPMMLVEALRHHGTAERAGPASNPAILAWAAETGLANVYRADATPWCGLFMALLAHRTGKPVPNEPLWALSWAAWEEGAAAPMLGGVLVFRRPGGGHVGLCVGEDAAAYHVLGGNQGDRVSIARLAKARLVAARHPRWRGTMPLNRRRVRLSAAGALSRNER
ncbi:MAG TPA: TIGR02594 family protein [Beijerinckiaceae bacterium]|jgi:uncharacterized protein (TIGR02594 family)